LRITGVRLIGKEANRWEEQHFLGIDDEAQPEYGAPPEAEVAVIREAVDRVGARALARASGVARGTIVRFLKGHTIRDALRTTLCLAADRISKVNGRSP
jgi:hypothetical protein